MATVGINPNEYWKNTWRENDFISKAFLSKREEEWNRTRNLEFRILTSVLVSNGKKYVQPFEIKSPKDLYLLPGEQSDEVILEGNDGADFIKKMFPKK